MIYRGVAVAEIEHPKVWDLQAQCVGGEAAGGERPVEFLTFMLGEEEYGIDILKVQEIRGYDNVTRIPGAPDFIKGLTNLRGLIVPIVDMRLKFQLGEPVYDHLTVVVVLNIEGRLVGIVVGSVSDVISVMPGEIQNVSDCSPLLKPEYLLGLISVGERMVILINVDRLMGSGEMGLVELGD